MLLQRHNGERALLGCCACHGAVWRDFMTSRLQCWCFKAASMCNAEPGNAIDPNNAERNL